MIGLSAWSHDHADQRGCYDLTNHNPFSGHVTMRTLTKTSRWISSSLKVCLSWTFDSSYNCVELDVCRIACRRAEHDYIQGRRNEFYLGVAQIIRKMRFCEFSKFLLYKSPILGVARATPATPVPPPLDLPKLWVGCYQM